MAQVIENLGTRAKAELATPTCYHCNARLPEWGNYPLAVNGVMRQFCCVACRSIAESFIRNGIESFYLGRDM